jgi:hypothetical protein
LPKGRTHRARETQTAGLAQDLPGQGKGDKNKVALARRLRQETTMKFKIPTVFVK